MDAGQQDQGTSDRKNILSRRRFLIGTAVLAAGAVLSGCGLGNATQTTGNAPLQSATGTPGLPEGELREYQGVKLTSIKNIRENSIKGPQRVDISTYRLDITGLVNTPKSYTYEEAIAHPSSSKPVTLHCVEGWDITVLREGIRLTDLFAEAGVDAKANTVIFYAYDGYTSSLPLTDVLSENMLLAYKINGVTLPAERGFPFELVAEDKWGYKSVKWVTKIELSNNSQYKGYWESRGYSNTGKYGEPMFGS